MCFFDVYDISDRTDPELVKEYKFEGRYDTSRMLGDYVYLILQTTPEIRGVYPTPVMVDGDVVRGMPARDIYYYPIPYRSTQLVTVHAINLMRPSADVESRAVAVDYGQNVYMSEDNIYITYREYVNEYELQQEIIMELMEPYLTDADKELIVKIKATDNEVLSQQEKRAKIFAVYTSYANAIAPEEQDELTDRAEEMLVEKLEEYEYFEFTVIHKISVDDGEIEVEETGKVPGNVINQFSMDEYDGVFRIATTVNARWSRIEKERSESTNNVYALDRDLEIIGELEGLAEGESIYATRFMGERLYLVTFKQIDPFFVIDLSNPRNIKTLGELKIPGFSRYLHPYDEDVIIGIGHDATETGRTKGLKISLFDVSDVANPEEIASFVTAERYAQSSAEYEHKAFLFSKEKNLLVIPAYSYDYSWRDGGSTGYNGAFVFHISEDEIELRGLIDHSMAKGSGSYYYGTLVERSLWIEELVYTKSPTLLRINRLSDLEGVKNVELTTQGTIAVY
jgi:uncharacterized secreted protein with C-terminal beta-propeller domain